MKIPALFKEYIWLVRTIYRARRISLVELNERWVETDMSGGVEMARTTFNRHKDAIQDIFGIYIVRPQGPLPLLYRQSGSAGRRLGAKLDAVDPVAG